MNPHLASYRVCQPDRTGHCNWRPISTRWARLVPSYILVIMTLAPAPASPEPAGSAVHGVGTCDTGGGIRTVQVTGLFDLSPSLVPSREVHEEPAAGTSPVSKGPTGTGAAPAS